MPGFFDVLDDHCRKSFSAVASSTFMSVLRDRYSAHPNLNFGVHPEMFTVSFPLSGQRFSFNAARLYLRNFDTVPHDLWVLLRYCIVVIMEV